MANILVASTPAPGHVNPMLSVARHLSSLGHSIIFLSGKLFHDQAVTLGFRFVPFTGKAVGVSRGDISLSRGFSSGNLA